MKKLIIFFLLSTVISQDIFARSETRSVRTPIGEIVSIGDSYINMVNKFQEKPISTQSYEIKENKTKYTVYEYIYLIDDRYYTISIVNGLVKSISWDRK